MPPTGSTTRWRRPPRRPSTCWSRSGSRRSARPPSSGAELDAAAHADGLNEPIAAWDWRYYAEKVRSQAKYDFDEAAVKPYFVLDNMVRGDVRRRREAVRRQLRRRASIARSITPTCAPTRCVGRTASAIGLFLHDNFGRTGKRSGRLDVELSRPGKPRRAGAADRRQQQQFFEGRPDAALASTTPRRCSTNSATGCTGC